MNWPLLSRMLGMLGMLVGGSMVLALPWAFPAFGVTTEFEWSGFFGTLAAIVCSLAVGGTLYWFGRNEQGSILRKEALAVVGLGWFLSGVLGALPFVFSGTQRAAGVPMTVVDALFESISGFTTTGASVLTELEDPTMVPRCVMFWRCFTHWLGGMGIIVLFVAILGQLGAGGKALVRREVPGPINESVRPRIQETASLMWTIYVGISGVLAVIFWLEGMPPYDALCHTFGTMATGGFSTKNASIGYYDSPLIEGTVIVFMLIAGTNFTLYYLILRGPDSHGPWYRRLSPLYRDPEYRVYLGILAVATVVLTINLMIQGRYPSEFGNWFAELGTSIRHAAFVSVSIMTTTGFGTEDFTTWTEFSKGLLLLLMFVGGCSGSTGGGVKVIRFILFFRVMRLEIEKAYRPNVVRRMRVFGLPVDDSLRHDVVVYFAMILLIFVSGWMTLAAIEPDTSWRGDGETFEGRTAEKLLDCASAVASCLNNIGPGLGVLGPHDNYADFSLQGKALLTLLMLLGRLELFAILVLFVPRFWRVQ